MAFLGGADHDPTGTRGAVLAELAIALMPLLLIFFTFVQLAMACTAGLVAKHAANMGARAAAVILPPNPGDVGTPEDVDRAVHEALGPWDAKMVHLEIVKIPAARPFDLVTVEVHATYRCTIPLGSRVLCGMDGLLELAPIVAQFPNQGARYQP